MTHELTQAQRDAYNATIESLQRSVERLIVENIELKRQLGKQLPKSPLCALLQPKST